GVSQTRRLHRLAKAVIVIDEAQAIPGGVLEPAIDVLRQLVEVAGSTVILSTATQAAGDEPAVAWLNSAREIVPDARRHFEVLRRVDWSIAEEAWDAER